MKFVLLFLSIVFYNSDAFLIANVNKLSPKSLQNMRGGIFMSSLKVSGEKIALQRSELIELCKGGPLNGVGSSDEFKSEVIKLCRELESNNPTEKPSSSPLLSGAWRLIFSSTDGSSAGKLGPFVGQVTQTLEMPSRRFVNAVRLGPTIGGAPLLEAALSARGEPTAPDAWAVIFESIALRILGLEVLRRPFPPPPPPEDGVGGGASGRWTMAFLDSRLRIVWAAGRDQERANVFVMERVGDSA